LKTLLASGVHGSNQNVDLCKGIEGVQAGSVAHQINYRTRTRGFLRGMAGALG